jgi:type III pantothenate kinase
MNLVIDIGNTRIKAGLFDRNILLEQAIWSDWSLHDLLEWVGERTVQQVMVSTVTDLMPELTMEGWRVMQLHTGTPLPFRNTYRTPETLGKDRVAAVAGAQALLPGSNCLLVDCGTCIKYDLIDADGVYHGGNIAPGASMRIQAMHHFTARLPEVPMAMPDAVLGYSTETALQNGALLGARLEIEGFLRLMELRWTGLDVVFTGGDADFFHRLVQKEGSLVSPHLTLIGLNAILNFNTP